MSDPAAEDGKTDEDGGGERQVVCSGCMAVVPESHIHVLPWFNDTVGRFVTTFRCRHCAQAAFDDTTRRLEATDDAELVASAAEVFERHGVAVLEYRRGDPPRVVAKILIRLLALLASGVLQLSIGPLAS
jgi:hypothetical protein